MFSESDMFSGGAEGAAVTLAIIEPDPLADIKPPNAFTELVRRFPEMRLAVAPAELQWGHGDGVVLRGLSALPVRLRGAEQPAP